MSDELTTRQQQVLAAIQLDPGATLEEIGAQIGVTRERVRQIAVKLEARGLIRKRVEMRREAIAQRIAVVSSELLRLNRIKKHYQYIRRRQVFRKRARLPDSGVLAKYPMPGTGSTCIFDGCFRPVEARGYCSLHYLRLRESGALWVQRITTPTCRDCRHPTYARGYCRNCYARHMRHGDLLPIQAPKNSETPAPKPYPRIEQRGSTWVLLTYDNGDVRERKFISEQTARAALQRSRV